MPVTASIFLLALRTPGSLSHLCMHQAFELVRVLETTFSCSPYALAAPWSVDRSYPSSSPPFTRSATSSSVRKLSNTTTQGEPSSAPSHVAPCVAGSGLLTTWKPSSFLKYASCAHDSNSLLRSPGRQTGSGVFSCSLLHLFAGSMSSLELRYGSQDSQQCTIIHPGLRSHMPASACCLQIPNLSRHGLSDGLAWSGTTNF
mmetsp:Transcript_4821/g.10182  ORF Transcript_4821/g.10182 Transcript_4821/m.10182 type:complete len:201 (-) Transcript_4821:639-1241(-)